MDELIINVIFDAGKGTSTVQSREAIFGKELGSLPTPVRSGYAFDGWYLGDEQVTPSTVLQSEEDVRLVAHWVKKKGTKSTSLIKKQKTMIVAMVAVIVVLAIALIIVNDLISVSTIEDYYYNESGELVTQKYYIKKVDNVYGMYDGDDVKMSVNSDGYHIALSGNQYSINQETGECKLYAWVDSFDESIGELLGFNARVMMFPQIEQSDIYSIEVKNDNETFTVIRHANGMAYLKGTEGRLNVLDDKAFANLAVSCGYTLTVEKLDFKSPEAPRLPNGEIDYAEYGLSDSDTPIIYTITKRAYDENGHSVAATGEGSSYTVKVGNKTLAGGGYYAQLVGRDVVYILSPTVAPTLVKPSERMVTPTIIYPMSATTYVKVKDFVLESASVTLPEAYRYLQNGGKLSGTKTPIVNFSYWDLLERENSMYAMHPYTTNTSLMEGYFLDSNNIFNALESLYRMSTGTCVKNGITEESLQEYIFNGEDAGSVYHLSFRYNILEREAYLKRLEDETEQEFNTRCFAQCKTILKQYGISDEALAQLTYEQCLEALEDAGFVLEDGVLYDKLTHLNQVYSICQGMLGKMGYTSDSLTTTETTNLELLEIKVKNIVDQIEETKAGVRYDEETKDLYIVNDILISQQKDGKYYVAVMLYDMIVEIDAYNFAFLNWNSMNWYSQYFTWIEIGYMSDLQLISKDGAKYHFSFDNSESDKSQGSNTKKLKIYSVSETGERNLISYKIEDRYVSDTGLDEVRYVSALDNFRSFYQMIQYCSLRGLIDEKELALMKDKDGNPMTPAKFRQLPDEECDFIMYYRAVDARGNSIAKVIRFYNYTEIGHAYLTIDVVDAFDKDGNPITDWKSMSNPEDGEGIFYVDTAYMQKLLKAADDFVNGKLITLK